MATGMMHTVHASMSSSHNASRFAWCTYPQNSRPGIRPDVQAATQSSRHAATSVALLLHPVLLFAIPLL